MRDRLLTVVALFAASPVAGIRLSVCGLMGTANNNGAYESTTLVLSAVPLGMIAGISYWLIRRARRQP